jgi:hypothetical protein
MRAHVEEFTDHRCPHLMARGKYIGETNVLRFRFTQKNNLLSKHDFTAYNRARAHVIACRPRVDRSKRGHVKVAISQPSSQRCFLHASPRSPRLPSWCHTRIDVACTRTCLFRCLLVGWHARCRVSLGVVASTGGHNAILTRFAFKVFDVVNFTSIHYLNAPPCRC